MRHRKHNLAIETAGIGGSLALGLDDELLAETELPVPGRNRVDLMPAIDALCHRQGVAAGDLGQLYLSIGPGSFTGLRIAVATAKMLADVLGLDTVAVPTLDVVAQNAPADAADNLAVCLNLKADTTYQGLHRRQADLWLIRGEPTLATLEQLLAKAPRPLAVLGDPLGDIPQPLPDDVTILPAELARPHARHVWRLGRERARRGESTDPGDLLPLYARAPEAEEQWNRRYGDAATIQTRAPDSGEAS